MNEIADLSVALSLSQESDGMNVNWKQPGFQVTYIVKSSAGVVFRLLYAIAFHVLHLANRSHKVS